MLTSHTDLNKNKTSCKIRPYTLKSNVTPMRTPYILLGAGYPAAHQDNCLMLLGSPPDMVHNPQLRKTHSSTQQARLIHKSSILKKGMNPCCSGFQVQGTANSPAGMALFHSLQLHFVSIRSIKTDILYHNFSIFATHFSNIFFTKYILGKMYNKTENKLSHLPFLSIVT